MNPRALPIGHWVIVRYDGHVVAAAHDDPIVGPWRRVRDGRARSGDAEAVKAWLAERRPGQLVLWVAA